MLSKSSLNNAQALTEFCQNLRILDIMICHAAMEEKGALSNNVSDVMFDFTLLKRDAEPNRVMRD